MIGSFIQGGLGNQLFQVAAGIAHAKKVGTTFSIIEGQHHLPLQGNSISTYKDNILRGVGSKSQDYFSNCTVFQEQGHKYSPIPEVDNIFLRGYFQSEKYFQDCKEDISELFSITPELEKIIEEEYPYLNDEKVVSLHVRRGDYLQNPDIHPTMTPNFYQEALEAIEDKDRVIVFSDDIPWCLEIFGTATRKDVKDFSFSVFKKDYLDLYTMSKCHHHILANSTFSWWGAWLSNTSGKIIAPVDWFGPQGPQETQDIIPERWERI